MGNIFSVFLSAGHGGSDSGAVAFGLKEKDINLQIMLSCKEILERHGVKVFCSRVTDENDPVTQEVNEANTSGADIAVSFHTNAGGGDGSESFYYSASAKGKRLAELCEKHTKKIGQNSRGTKFGNHLWFIKKTNMTAVLCECAFVDNDKDNDIIDTVAETRAFGEAYAKAILEYFGINYREPAEVLEIDILEFQKAAIADGFNFPKYGANGKWGAECESVASRAVLKKRLIYTYRNLTKIVQRAVGVEADGKFGSDTRAAVIEFQKAHGLEPDGVVGINTWRVILGV